MAAGIKFACPHCGRSCKVPTDLAGKQGRCPGCKKGLEVPLASEVPLSDEALDGKKTGRKEKAAPSHDPTPGRICPTCRAEVPHGVTECPECGKPLPHGCPWQVVAALVLALPAALPALVFAKFGLVAARRRHSHIKLAWTAVILSGINLTIGTIYMVVKAINS